MQEFYQKYHGLPGIGVSGQTGNRGKKGTGVYIGFVNDFFNTNSIDVDTIVRVARQIKNPSSGFTGSFYTNSNGTALIDAQFIDNNYLKFTALSDVVISTNNEGIYNYYNLYQMGHGTTEQERQNKNTWTWNDEVDQYISPTRVIVDMQHLPYDYVASDEPYDEERIIYASGEKTNDKSRGVTVLYATDTSIKYFKNIGAAYMDPEEIAHTDDTKEEMRSLYIKPVVTSNITNEDISAGVFYDQQEKIKYEVPDKNEEDEKYNQLVEKYGEILDAFFEEGTRTPKYYGTNFHSVAKYKPESDEDFYNIKNGTSDKVLNYVHWIETGASAVAVPTTLKDEFVEGDILYVYTNKSNFEKNGHKIDYMINVTADMVGANYAYVLSKAVAQNPFAFAQFSDNNDRVVLNNDVNLISYDAGDDNNILMNRMKKRFVENFNEQLDFNDYILQISEFNENDNNANYILLNKDSGDALNKIFSVNSKDLDTFILDGIDTSIKISSLYINDETKTPRLYTKNLLLPPYINFTNEAFLPALTEESYNDSNASFKMNKSNYVLDNANTLEMNYNYGALVVDNSTGECKEVINPANGILYLDVEFSDSTRQKYIPARTYNFSVIPFIDIEGCTRYFARTTNIQINVDEDGAVTRTMNSYEDSYDEDVNWENTNDVEFTLVGNIGVEKTEDASLVISFNNPDIDVQNVSIYLNGTDHITSSTTAQQYEWFTIDSVSDYDTETNSYTINLKNILSNLPNEDGQNPETVYEYFSLPKFVDLVPNYDASISHLFDMILDKSLISTLSRSALITVIYKMNGESGKNEVHKAYYKLQQPGFNDPRVRPQVQFKNKIEQIELEECNSNDKGVLGNQFQYFTDISINGFSTNEWGKFNKNITVDLTLETRNKSYETMLSYNYSAAHKYANIKQAFISENDLGDAINGFNTHFYIHTSDISDNATIAELEENAAKTFISFDEIDSATDFAWSVESKFYSDIELKNELVEKNGFIKVDKTMYETEEAACKFDSGVFNVVTLKLKNIPIEYLQNADKHLKIRTLFEESNPVLAKIEYNFVVTNIVIHYSNGDETQDFFFGDSEKIDARHEAGRGTLYDWYDDQLQGYLVPKYMVGEQEFFIRPISYVAAPQEVETSTGLRYSPVKISGSTDNIKLGVGMYCEKYFNSLANNQISASERSRLFKSSFEWKKAELKKRYLQDNISSIEVIANNPYSLFDKVSQNNSFVKILNNYDDNFAETIILENEKVESDDFVTSYTNKKPSTILNANESEYPIFRNFGPLENIYNIFGNDCPYLAVTYRNDWLHPKLRNDVLTFYYNDELYDAERYSQYELNSPQFVSAKISALMRPQELLDSMDTWNFEYQHSGYASYKNTYKGVVSTYATGYEYLNDGADEGQYENEYLSLNEVCEMNDVDVLDSMYAEDLSISALQNFYPEKDKAFRTILYSLRWQYPVFEDIRKYYGFDLVSPYMSSIDSVYLDIAFNHNKDAYDGAMELYGNTLDEINEAFAQQCDDASTYYENKLQNVSDRDDRFIFHNMIPYNLLYNVYPRIAYNDEKKSIIVLMLRRPSICDNNSTTLSKRYFEMTSYPECEQPYSLS